ncbi:hypothetical protein OAM67_01555 [bacterium]|nr:hypothetical protein [bacterium]
MPNKEGTPKRQEQLSVSVDAKLHQTYTTFSKPARNCTVGQVTGEVKSKIGDSNVQEVYFEKDGRRLTENSPFAAVSSKDTVLKVDGNATSYWIHR